MTNKKLEDILTLLLGLAVLLYLGFHVGRSYQSNQHNLEKEQYKNAAIETHYRLDAYRARVKLAIQKGGECSIDVEKPAEAEGLCYTTSQSRELVNLIEYNSVSDYETETDPVTGKVLTMTLYFDE